MVLMTLVLILAAAGAAGFASLRWPAKFRPYAEAIRNMVLVAGIVLLVWNLAVAVTVLAIDAGGLLIPGGFFEAQRIEQALVIVGPVTILVSFTAAWIFFALLDRCVIAPRVASATS